MTDVTGHCHPDFEAVAEALATNLADGQELGEAVAVMVDGELVVDLWGGHRDGARSEPWEEDTTVCVFSVGKPVAALPPVAADRFWRGRAGKSGGRVLAGIR